MRDLILLFVHVLATSIRLARPGGVRSVLAESVLLKHQLLILNRSRRRAPNLRASDRLIAGFCALLVLPRRLVRSAVVVKPSNPVEFPSRAGASKIPAAVSPKHKAKPGPKGPSSDLIRAVIEMKQRNPRWGCPRIAEQIALAFGVPINKDVVRRILAPHYHPSADGAGPSWLTFLGHIKDSLYSIDLFRC
jgi:putative transposase